MECPSCHSSNAPGARSCAGCGADLPPDFSPDVSPGLSPDLSRTEAIPSSVANLQVGAVFAGRYRITLEIGRGGMGMVYKAEDVRLKRPVALKFLPWWLAGDRSAKERFIHEAQAASALDHTNVCTIYEVDETADGLMYIAMAFCDGEPLKLTIERGPLDVADTLDVAIQICDGLVAAHGTGLIHRDIKPANIMVGESGRVKIVDFGLAKLAGQARLTRTGTVVGTAAYMSPEQARGAEVDARTDIWSLGIVLYEMLTGQVPFRGDSEQAVIHSVLSEVPELPSSVNREVPSAVESAVLKCLSKDPAERFSSAADLRSLLASLRAGLPCADPAYSQPVARAAGAARRAGRPSQAPRWLGPSRSRLLLYALAAVCTLVGLSVLPPSGPILNLRAAALRLGISHLPAGKHVALLPLEVSGGDPETRALADGLVDVQTRKVAWIDGFTDSLWVAPVAEVISAGALDPRQARDVLGVNLTIGGSLTLVGDVVRVTLDLIDAASGARLKRNAVSDPLANLSTWQDSLSVIMMRMLEVPLPAARCADLSIGCATVPAAFRSYLVGRGYFHPFVGDPNLSAAAAWAGRAVQDDSSFAMAYAGLAEVYLRDLAGTKDTAWAARAEAACRRALASEPRLALPHAVLGQIALTLGRPEQAIASLEQAVAIDSNYADAYTSLASAYKLAGRNDLTLAALKQVVRVRPRSPKAYRTLGHFYYAQGDYERAIKPFMKVIDLVPKSHLGYNDLGATYFGLERWPEAEEMFRRAIAIEPLYRPYSNLGTISFYKGRFADAASMYKKALDMSGEDYRVWGHYAEACYWSPGLREEATANFETAASLAEKQLDRTPDDAGILADLASYYARMGDGDRAQDRLSRVLATNPDQADAMVRIAETYEGLGDMERAKEWIGRALAQGCPVSRIQRSPGLKRFVESEAARK